MPNLSKKRPSKNLDLYLTASYFRVPTMSLKISIDVEDVDSCGQSLEYTFESSAFSDSNSDDDQDIEEERKSTADTNETNSIDHSLGLDSSSDVTAKPLEDASHSKDGRYEDPSPPTSPKSTGSPRSETTNETKERRKRDSFLKRFTVFAGVPGQTAVSSQRSSLYSLTGFGDFRRFSLASSVSSQATEKSDATHKSSGSHGKLSKYISSFSGDTAFPNLDFSETVSGPSQSLKDGKTEDEQAISFQKKLKHIREITGTQVALRAEEDPDSPQRPNDPRMWHTKNLRCASCMGACAVCNTACCMYEAGCRAKKDPSSGAFKAAQAERIVLNIEALGSHVRDNTTFIMCTLGGGCGRYVCPECCGICINVACRDVQCKECKPDPWGPCDWHDEGITFL
ncbi:hypothetical protein SI65_04074 [Aspergillus cristatus]|uniref:Uncharacterized protein n=1 Tax=Aspergillus cristatus TaxID=573508 RepID=A0A1E3BJR3_ASPCR|nr:hypothetical protein SI65_04074 [Aspergillus cristatus]